MRSGYREAMRYLSGHKGANHLATINSFSEFYFGRNVAEQTPPTLDELKDVLRDGGYRFVVLDFMSHRVLKKETKMFIESRCRPCAVFANEIGANYFTLIESLGYHHFEKDYIKNALVDPYAKVIAIYKAQDILEQLSIRNFSTTTPTA
jgi:hypothetical protein